MAFQLTVESPEDSAHTHKPAWLRIRPGHGKAFGEVTAAVRASGVATVCTEAKCPNLTDCWSSGTATFMVMGDTCTRGCRFCSVKKGARGQPLDPEEPQKVASAVKSWGLKYAVLTSVDRDDLDDFGASHFAECIREVRKTGALVEVLTPDFLGRKDLVEVVASAKPDVFAHNIETVRRLQKVARDPRAGYAQSLSVLKEAKKAGVKYTKSSIMVGLGETEKEVFEAMGDLRSAGVDVVTFGQYLQPTPKQLPVAEFIAPERFAAYRKMAEQKSFLYCASGPFVRSSYRAAEFFLERKLK